MSAVLSGSDMPSGLVVETTGGPIEAKRVVTCAGLHADEVANAVSGYDGSDGLRVVASLRQSLAIRLLRAGPVAPRRPGSPPPAG